MGFSPCWDGFEHAMAEEREERILFRPSGAVHSRPKIPGLTPWAKILPPLRGYAGWVSVFISGYRWLKNR